jgi:toxin YoeB
VRLVFEEQGWEDYTYWLKTDRKMLERINKLIEASGGIPSPASASPSR